MTLLCACDYYKKRRDFFTGRSNGKHCQSSAGEKARMKADNYLKAGRYGRSFQEYQRLLHGPLAKELSTKGMGMCFMIRRLRCFMYLRSARQQMVSKEAYARNHRPESLQQYLYVLLACGDKEMFDRECEAAGKSKEEKKALCEAWEQACSTAGNDSDEVCINRAVREIKESLEEPSQK